MWPEFRAGPDPEGRRGLCQRAAVHGGLQEVRGHDRGQRPAISATTPTVRATSPIDRNESRAMRAFALDYLAPAQKRFLNINYQFFHPLPADAAHEGQGLTSPRPSTPLPTIGGDMIIFKPAASLHEARCRKSLLECGAGRSERTPRGRLPTTPKARASPTASTWAARRTAGKAMPRACTFRPDKPEWKKSDAAGRRAPGQLPGLR